MANLSSRPLRPNPFHTYRDPKTGKWLVVESASSETDYYPAADSLSGMDLTQNVPRPIIKVEITPQTAALRVANSAVKKLNPVKLSQG